MLKKKVLQYIQECSHSISKNQIARFLKVRGDNRISLKKILNDLIKESEIRKEKGNRYCLHTQLPKTLVTKVVNINDDGEIFCTPLEETTQSQPPTILLEPNDKKNNQVSMGSKILIKIKKDRGKIMLGKILKIIDKERDQIVGVYWETAQGGTIQTTSKKERFKYFVDKDDSGDAQSGDIVIAETKTGRYFGSPTAKVLKSLQNFKKPGSASLIAIMNQKIPNIFPKETLDEAQKAKSKIFTNRGDLRKIPLVTIDGEDAKDYDDSIFSEADQNKNNKDGWHIIIAIADVAFYVQSGGELDRTARERGNSTYLPDQVIPMLPEILSNGLCSLQPNKDRACIAIHIWINKSGEMINTRFERALMKSCARLTYKQAQSAHEGKTDRITKPIMDTVIKPIYGAYQALLEKRKERGTIEIEIPENKIVFDKDGKVDSVAIRERLDSHKLIEEFMISANEAVAKELSSNYYPCIFRVHKQPTESKLEILESTLSTLDIHLPKNIKPKPKHFRDILDKAKNKNVFTLVNELVLRSQSKAEYSPQNTGHFGLGLRNYTHFTSPIRRYSDLIVHRALISKLKLGSDGLDNPTKSRLEEISAHISETERRSEAAEREAFERFMANFLKKYTGKVFKGIVSGITNFNIFARIPQYGIDGIIPYRSVRRHYRFFDQKKQILIGRNGQHLKLGEEIKVKIEESDHVTGGLILSLA